MKKHELWLKKPEAHDFDAAKNYLSLVMEPSLISNVIYRLKYGKIEWFEAKDILRASELPLLPKDNEHVIKDLKKVKKGKRLSPILLCRGNVATGRPLMIVDGYHRVCASYYLDENNKIPVVIV